jgi:dTMP kinase
MAEGKLVALEGIDGSGLTTQAHKLANWFRGQGQRCRLTKEPSEGPVGALIRLVVQKRLRELAQENDLDHWLALLFAADRQDHLTNVILPTIRSGIHVITDRYYLSSFAYQGLKVHFDHLSAMNGRCRRPDLTVFLNVPVEVCRDRIDRERSQNRWGTDLYEEPDKLAQVRRKFSEAMDYLKARGDRIEIVNGNDTPDGVQQSVLGAVQKMLQENDAPKSRLLLPHAAGIATVP